MTGLTTELCCVECGKTAEGEAASWRAYLTVDDEVAFYCPECAEREFRGDRISVAVHFANPS